MSNSQSGHSFPDIHPEQVALWIPQRHSSQHVSHHQFQRFSTGKREKAEQSSTHANSDSRKPPRVNRRFNSRRVFIRYAVGNVSFSSPPQSSFFTG